MLYLLDCDLHGLDSVSDCVGHKNFTVVPCPSYSDYDKAVVDLIVNKDAGPNDTVIVDTLTSLLETTRADAKLGTELSVNLFERGKTKYMEGDKNYLNVYNMAQQVVMRRLKNLAGRGVRLIVLAHEAERVDETTMTKKRQPDVNPAFIGDLVGASSDVFRLFSVPEDIVGQGGKVTVKADTRVLYLRRGEEYIAKYNVSRDRSESVPRYIVDPTLPKIVETLGKTPVFLTVYGHPGAGKTTLAVSALQLKGTK